ncbi:MAG: pantoate--beta-alanine ligase [Gammaproteobacteria bacterium]|nr:pantoate--beta-alanine ligase [Gammaproteobacteria bacterium]
METVFDLQQLREKVRQWRREGLTIALVPTMGNLHAGHISLLERAREIADRTVVSIFVNPIQFGRGEDYERYPSTLEADSEKLSAAGLHLLFAPNLGQLYPGGMEDDTRVTVPQLSNILCGAFRPGHFSGVATVVTKLFINVAPDKALFGEKDYQQLLVIRRLTADLCFPIEIIGMPIIREADGLAMSSRNGYLSEEERSRAPLINQSLRSAAEALKAGGAITDIEREHTDKLAAAGFRPEYFSIRRLDDLALPGPADKRFAILVAAWLGSARLIDNIHVDLGG